jgi:hypothetical protein
MKNMLTTAALALLVTAPVVGSAPALAQSSNYYRGDGSRYQDDGSNYYRNDGAPNYRSSDSSYYRNDRSRYYGGGQHRYYQGRTVYHGYDRHYRYRCGGGDGAVGTIAGGAGGAVLGNVLGGGTLGTIAGGLGGALLGRHFDKQNTRSRQGC